MLGDSVRQTRPPSVVFGTEARSGATTTARGLATRLRGLGAVRPIVVDGETGRTDPGLGDHWRDNPPWSDHAPPFPALRSATEPRRYPMGALLARYGLIETCFRLCCTGVTPIVDAGSARRGPYARELRQWRPDVQLIAVVVCRSGMSARVAQTLRMLHSELGEAFTADTTLVVAHHTPYSPPMGDLLEREYAGWIRTVIDLPYDRYLSTGHPGTASGPGAATRAAFTALTGSADASPDGARHG